MKKRNVVPYPNFGNERNSAENEQHQYPVDFRMVYGRIGRKITWEDSV